MYKIKKRLQILNLTWVLIIYNIDSLSYKLFNIFIFLLKDSTFFPIYFFPLNFLSILYPSIAQGPNY